jgi:hypothetical protein
MPNAAKALLLSHARHSPSIANEPVHHLFAFAVACASCCMGAVVALPDRIAHCSAATDDIMGNV